MYFLGQAANYHAGDILRHTFAFGTPKDAELLRRHLANRYLGDDSPQNLKNVILYGTGRSALAAAIRAVVSVPANIQSGSGDKSNSSNRPVVCATALTCYAVVQAIEAAGCQPVFADVDRETLHFGVKELKKTLKLHPDLRAIIVQNNLGYPADMPAIAKFARQHHLVIIEDLAHSAGIRYSDGREAGTVGDATILSFGKGKSIDTIAGGALIIRQTQISEPSEASSSAQESAIPQKTTALRRPTIPTRRPALSNSLRARWYPFFGACIRGLYHLHLGRYLTSLLLKLHFIERSADAPLRLDTRCTYWQAKLALRQLENLPDPRPPLRRYYFIPNREATLQQLEKLGHILNDTWYDCPVAPERYYNQSHFQPEECPVAVELAKQLINTPLDYPAHLFTAPPSDESWHRMIKNHPETNFLQSPEWYKVNQKIGHLVTVERFGFQSPTLMIIKNARRGRYLEIPGGPLLNWEDQAEVEAAFAKIRQIAKDYHCVFVRFRPQLPKTPQNISLMQSVGARIAPFHLHAEHTVMIDLEQSEEQLLKNMRRQTRYEVRRSLKQGIEVTHGNSEELFREFHQVQAETAARQHFIPPRLKDLLAYREAFGAHAQIYVAQATGEARSGGLAGVRTAAAGGAAPAARGDGPAGRVGEPTLLTSPVAYGLILRSGAEADYFEAASTPLNRKLPGAYALQWQVMRDLKKQGVKRYNLWGIAPPGQPHHRYAKVTTFKTGFGGEITEYLPAHDLVINPLRYQKTRLIETIRKKRRHLT